MVLCATCKVAHHSPNRLPTRYHPHNQKPSRSHTSGNTSPISKHNLAIHQMSAPERRHTQVRLHDSLSKLAAYLKPNSRLSLTCYTVVQKFKTYVQKTCLLSTCELLNACKATNIIPHFNTCKWTTQWNLFNMNLPCCGINIQS